MPKSSTNSLQEFIAHAREKGMDHQTIRMLLLSAGWKERDVAKAIGAEGLDMPVPMPQDAGGARDAFFHLLAFAGLYISVISLLILIFSYINWWFPDPVLEPYFSLDGLKTTIRWSVAALIVAFPIFLWMTRLVLKEMHEHPEKGSSGVRRWLTYLTLFVAASVLMGDVVTLIFSLLEGEITVRFLLKVIVVFVVTGLTFLYYLQSLRRPVDQHGNMHRVYGAVAGTVVLLTIAYGLFLAGSPGTERQRKIDEQRVNDIRIIAEAAFDYAYDGQRWMQPVPSGLPRALPDTLEALAAASVTQRVPLTDPEGMSYTYSVASRTRFEVCSVFSFESVNEYAPFWDHPAGEHCFAFDTSKPSVP